MTLCSRHQSNVRLLELRWVKLEFHLPRYISSMLRTCEIRTKGGASISIDVTHWAVAPTDACSGRCRCFGYWRAVVVAVTLVIGMKPLPLTDRQTDGQTLRATIQVSIRSDGVSTSLAPVFGNEAYLNYNVAKCKSSHVNRRCKSSDLNLSEMQQIDVF